MLPLSRRSCSARWPSRFPIVLHLLRRDVAPEVPFTRRAAAAPIAGRARRRRRLRDLLLLAARVAALLLLAAAFARPYVQGAAPAPVRVVAIDRSFSMGAPGRLSSGARARARRRSTSRERRARRGRRVRRSRRRARRRRAARPTRAPRSTGSRRGSARRATAGVPAGGRAGGRRGRTAGRHHRSPARRLGRRAHGVASRGLVADRHVTSMPDGAARAESRGERRDASRPSRVVAAIRNDGAARARRQRSRRRTTDGRSRRPTTASAPGRRSTCRSRGAHRNRARSASRSTTRTGFRPTTTRFVALGSRGAAEGAHHRRTGRRESASTSSRALGAVGATVDGRSEVVPAMARRRRRMTARAAGELSRRRAALDAWARARRARAADVLVNGGGGLFIAAAPEVEPVGARRDDRLAAAADGSRAGRTADARRDRSASSDLPAVRRAGRQPRPGARSIAPGACRRRAGGRRALHERHAGAPRAGVRRRPRRCSSPPTSTAAGTTFRCTRRSCRSRSRAVRYVAGDRRPPRDYTVAERAGRGAPACRASIRTPDNRPFAVNVDTRESALRAHESRRTSRAWCGDRRGSVRARGADRGSADRVAAELLAVRPGAHDCYTGCRIGGRARVTVHDQLRSLLSSVRRRWRAEVALRAVGRGRPRGRRAAAGSAPALAALARARRSRR